MELSVVIMCKNELANLPATITAAQQVSNNVVIVDTGSTDGTLQLLDTLNVQVIHANWQGFGPTKNLGIQAAKHDWILSIDADEVIDETLVNAIKNCEPKNELIVYKIYFLTYLGNTALNYGQWRGDNHIRVFNKKNTKWNNAEVHEFLVYQTTPVVETLNGKIHHKTIATEAAMKTKFVYYANLFAQNKYKAQKKYGVLKKYLSASFNFIKNYIFKLGFMDGYTGWVVAKANCIYTFNKYYFLEQLYKQKS